YCGPSLELEGCWMLNVRRRFLTSIVLCCAAAVAQAQTPSAPMTLVVPYPAGGPLDISARILSAGASAQLGPIAVENKPGAGGGVGADLVAKSPAGQNRLLMGAVATHAVNPWLFKDFAYDPIKDFK